MPPQDTSILIDHFFRTQFAKSVAYLTGKFGPAYLEAAEDAVQEALAKAMQTWPFQGIPDNTTGWVIRVAQNKLIDHLRRQQKVFYATQLPETEAEPKEIEEGIFADEQVKMMFACCNPALSTEYQLILTLKILGGLSIKEISVALIKKEETVAKSYTRAKKRFREANIQLQLPPAGEISARADNVLSVIYLLFNEGYKSTSGSHLIRKDLCDEAMRLNDLLLQKPETNTDKTRALMALMHFQVSRFESRTDEDGNAISLQFQDRASWKQQHITLGNRYLTTVEKGMSNLYFLQAAINGIHCAAKSYEETNWTSILLLYNQILSIQPNPLIALYRIYPLAQVHGPQKALLELDKLVEDVRLKNHQLIPATQAELYLMMKDSAKAKEALMTAIERSENVKDRLFLEKKLLALAESAKQQ